MGDLTVPANAHAAASQSCAAYAFAANCFTARRSSALNLTFSSVLFLFSTTSLDWSDRF